MSNNDSKGGSMPTPTPPSTAQSPSFQDLWLSFYSQARKFVETNAEQKTLDEQQQQQRHDNDTNDAHTDDTDNNNKASPSSTLSMSQSATTTKQTMTLLTTIVKLVFGLDETKKTFVVQHDRGALWLVLALANLNDSIRDDNAVTQMAIKAIRCCVVKNPAGRSRCRPEVLEWVQATTENLLEKVQSNDKTKMDSSAVLMEEAMTTLAAICMGDDLNALQASIRMRELVNEAVATFPNQAGLQQKLAYLGALFDAIEKEQADLLTTVANDRASMVEAIQKAELLCRPQGQEPNDTKKESTNETVLSLLTTTIDSLGVYRSHTKLLDSLLLSLHAQRCDVRATTDWEGLLVDAEACLALQASTALPSSGSVSSPLVYHKLRAKALHGLGRNDDAREALGKAVLMQPQDKELQEMMEALEV